MTWQIYRDINLWKKPFHALIAYLAKIYLGLLKAEVIGVTGSVGKTLTQSAIYHVLAQKYKVTCGTENIDPTFRIPQTILKTRPWHNFIILEYGVEFPSDMDYYVWLARPKIAVVTGIAPTHTKYFKSELGVFTEKVKLIKALPQAGAAILNRKDSWAKKMQSKTKAKVLWFNNDSSTNVKISSYSQNLDGAKFELLYKGEKAAVTWQVVGRHHLLSALAASSVGLELKLTLKQIAQGLSQVKAPAHRLNVIKTEKLTILDDTYNSSPKAAHESIKTLLELGRKNQKIAVLGEMKDLGDLSKLEHTALGKFIAHTNLDYLITIGKTAAVIGKSASTENYKGKVINCDTADAAKTKVKMLARKDSLVLVKGSRHTHLERIVQGLQGMSTEISCYHCGNLK